MTVQGASIIAGERVEGSHGSFRAENPATGEQLDPEFTFVGSAEIDRAVATAGAAFDAYRSVSPRRRAEFLERIAEFLLEARGELVDRAALETGLGRARLEGEHARTVKQLRLFARELRLGEHEGVRIDHARGEGATIASPDIRQRRIALGPVVVFGASNFPLAFSTAGGDTASALAAGCPVIVKGHNAHAGTAELAGQAVTLAVQQCELPAGVFSILFGSGTEIGQALVAHPGVKAVAFTGSQAGGTALMRTAAARPEPIPVYAEMSSTNPVVVLPGALAADVQAVAAGFIASLTLGAGQFCTNPGMVFVPRDETALGDAIADGLSEATGQTMLTADIRTAYETGVERAGGHGAELFARGQEGATANAPAPALFRTTASHLQAVPGLHDEVFGAAGLLVSYRSVTELISTLEGLPGQLSISIHAAPSEHDVVQRVLPTLERKAGRIVLNGWPTGVEVNDAIVHGGPFPATSDSRTTSVGSLAIERFQRPVSYQGFTADLLPEAVRDDNPLHLPSRVDGELRLR
jgi:NADP-dependent aldehyde dehydrogenase